MAGRLPALSPALDLAARTGANVQIRDQAGQLEERE